MGSSKNKNFFDALNRPPPNPNAVGATAGNSKYNVPVVSPYESGQPYQPFFMQQAMNPTAGKPQSYFNTYGSVGQDPSLVPYATNSGGISPALQNFATSGNRVRFPMI